MNIVYRAVRTIFRLFFRIYGRWEVIGRDNVPKAGPVIIAPNHVSFADPPLVGAALTRECRFMARHDLWDKKIMKWLMPRIGAFPVHRGKMDRQAIRLGLEALAQGYALVVFPEGARSDDGKLQRGELGTALFVQKSGAPVVPTAVIGAYEMLPPHAKKLTRSKVKCVFGKPLQFEKGATRDEILRSIMRSIAALLTEHGIPTSAKEDAEPTAQTGSSRPPAAV
jgi:1-acyl-sn-glycerol-3-phosphate acyltransferase